MQCCNFKGLDYADAFLKQRHLHQYFLQRRAVCPPMDELLLPGESHNPLKEYCSLWQTVEQNCL
ncbi:hypothetical protein L798_04463 [Zootermopsis nevadensis]|uniref:Uncharacterized protein n=1 Tax=Zootermopsis nevadensis TaxID=136037 RepID=A0A067QSG4_ZOONE|nr:hypothetical protein L798_04463 [Zootermopsis nevadensis]